MLSLASVARMSDEQVERVSTGFSGGLTMTAASLSARTAAARPSTWLGGRTVRPAGAAKPAGRISALPPARCSRSMRCSPRPDPIPLVAIFCNEVKGKSMLALSRDLGTQYKTAFVLAHKMREAMAAESRGARVGGPGRKAEVDGGYFGGYVKRRTIARTAATAACG